ncbi:MAG: OmpA family protein [Candidatus Kapabacteria bacterium]|nr:OmpA family protein [Candidatus Kapabacteria bacterium]
MIFLFPILTDNIGIGSFCLLSQEEFKEIDSVSIKPKYGLFLSFGPNFYNADFRNLPGVPNCCPKFSSGSGFGYSFGVLYDFYIVENQYIGLRAEFSKYDGILKTTETTNGIIDGKSAEVSFEHLIDAKISSLGLNGFYSNTFYKSLSGHFGLRIGFPLSGTYKQKEEIVKPADKGTFLDGTRVRNENSGNIPELNGLQLSLNLGFSYELPLNRKKWLFLVPEVFYGYNFTNIVKEVDWNLHYLRFGAAIKYRIPPPPPPPPPPPLLPPDPDYPLPPKPPVLFAELDIMQLDTNKNVQKDFKIKIEDFTSLNLRPLLNYIFFDENSAEIPKRYHQLKRNQTNSFSIKDLANLDVIPTYYHILNIVGKRLNEIPNAKITLVGTNQNFNEEKGNLELSERRALAVKDYLVNVWNVNESQIKVTARNLPKEPANNNEEGGPEENRRVEILSDDWRILEPVITGDTLRKISETIIRFLPKIKADAGLNEWTIDVKQNQKSLIRFFGEKEADKIDWFINQKDTAAPKKGGFVEVSLKAKDKLGQEVKTEPKKIPIEQLTIDRKRLERIADKEFEYYSLILFDYGKSDLGKENRSVLDFVKSRVSDKSIVTITGYTDSIGDEETNLKLSEARAKAAAKRLNIPNAKVFGVGESVLLYDNTLPEGRFYCRTVKITIETPVQEN